MKIALLADIHANLEALDAVLEDIKKNEITDILSLGDNVGYGPDPVEVLQKLHALEIFSLEGNHDFAVVNPKSFADATDLAMEALEWTRFQLWEAVKKDENFQDVLQNYLGSQSCCTLQDDARIILVHGRPGPEKTRFDYLLQPEDMLKPASFMQKKGLKICFFGHTHRQVLWEVDPSGVSLVEFETDQPVVFTEEEMQSSQLMINPGSVGQPRDRNPDSGYMIYETREDQHIFTFKRVVYDIEKTREKIYSVEHLDKRLGDRLLIGA